MLLDQLSADHRNFFRVLTLLEEQIDELCKSDTPDYYLLLKILQYFQEYSNYCHHPVEDILFSLYLKRSSENANTIKELLQEHTELEEITLTLKNTVEAILLDGIVDRIKFIEQLSEFLRQQRSHIDTEEIKIFPQIRRTLRDDDWKAVKASLCLREDPVFGPQKQKDYEVLYRQITS